VAELASENTYRKVADVLKEWTAVSLSHTTVGKMVKRVGKTQAEADRALVEELEVAASLPGGKKVDYLFSEADGVFVRGLKKKQSMEVHHAILYEGWEANGKRVSLRQPTVIMTTEAIQTFWDEVQAKAANTYSLEKAHVITNSDGGAGYTAERFQTAFSQSEFPVLNQLDTYHVAQAIVRTFGGGKSEIKEQIRKAIRTHDLDQFTLYLDTHESTLTDEKSLKKVKEFRSYILKNWDRIFDWRDKVENVPEGARGLGAMESNQRHISFRMKKRGMHWSKAGAEAMVKVKQGILNGTLREAYLKHRSRSERKQRNLKQFIRMSQLLKQPVRPSVGVKHGSVALHSSSSSAMGHLSKILELSF
ncbi:ISLre2 family transposase, partial [Weizmannia sp. CD-2023]|uniref:ISLre2 family transposase n=1 Tax=Weizmannia sp. CD-2023 TaxID=3037263 RepID=UPI002E23B9BA